ncbi:hypothetical protein BDV33DRAFT_206544 [Aspergillus novoparasiticus]|uniref:Uncharacterized protein n=1 Tax=Aspergillus novoparasiticus TaxID=986946 RepID=A0A5N6EJQ7_9EURO|nr:hypothetical protein BDV33DRAFT_206544 [Aspergillus novoparasiticus]
MLAPSTTPPEPSRPEVSYPANVYEWTPDGWRFLGFMPERLAGSVPPEWEGDGDDATAVCPPGYILVAVQPCPVGYILVEEPGEMTEPGDPSEASPATATITDPPPVPVETTPRLTSNELSTFDHSRGYKAARDVTYVILFLSTVVLLSLAARSYTRRSKKASRGNAAMSLHVTDLPNGSPSELPATEKTWLV